MLNKHDSLLSIQSNLENSIHNFQFNDYIKPYFLSICDELYVSSVQMTQNEN